MSDCADGQPVPTADANDYADGHPTADCWSQCVHPVLITLANVSIDGHLDLVTVASECAKRHSVLIATVIVCMDRHSVQIA